MGSLKLGKMSELQKRSLMSSIFAISMLIVIFLSHIPTFSYLFFIMTASLIGLALWEYYGIAREKGCFPLVKIGVIGSVIYVFAVFLRAQMAETWMLPEMALGGTLIAGFLYYFIKGSDPFVNLAVTFFGILYLTIPLSYLIEVNYFRSETAVINGSWSLIYLLFVSKFTDTGAYFVGKKIGKHKLTTYISPKKTWEGAIGGLLSALLISVLFYLFFNFAFDHAPLPLTFWQSIWLGVLISVTAQFGDLAESLLKRDVGVKDSSDLPGLGGFLDVVDSLVFTIPLMYIFLKIHF